MRYVAAYLLAVMGGNQNPSTDDINTMLISVGIESDPEKVKKVISELSGKSIEDVIAKGESKLASMPSGGGGMATASSPAAAAGAPAEGKKEEEKKKEEKKESESEDDDMGFGLFD